MNLAGILDDLTAWIEKYTVLPNEHAAPTLALWAAHTWVSPAFYTTPRLVLSSPVPGSGKTRVLELLALVCFNPKMTVSSSTAALFRRIGQAHRNNEIPPTILFDEIDEVFGASRPSEQTEQLRSLMNSGYKRGATIDRCEGDASKMDVIEWPVFSPLALAGLAGRLPDTITTRSIVIEMRKRAPGEQIAPYRERDATAEIAAVVDGLKAWAAEAGEHLSRVQPSMPEGVEDRPAEVWEPLLAVADMAGGRWPEIARKGCRSFVFAPSYRPMPLGVELLQDIREVMGHGGDTTRQEVDRIKTTDLLVMLKGLDDSPWGVLDGGRGLNARRLSQLLAGYSVAPVPVRVNGIPGEGYMLAGNEKQDGLADAWNRYLPSLYKKSVICVTPVTSQVDEPETVTDVDSVTVTSSQPVTPPRSTGPSLAVAESALGNATDVDGVTVAPSQSVTVSASLTSGVTDVTGVTDYLYREPGAGVDVDSQARAAVLNALSDTTPQTLTQIKKSVLPTYRDRTEELIAALIAAGKVEDHGDGTYSLKAHR